jgi:hypothetical protein
MTVVTLAGDTVVAGTAGDESAVALSTDDGYAFNDVGLIDTELSVIDDFAVNADSSKVYLATHSADSNISLWVKEARWTRILSLKNEAANPMLLVRIAPDDDSAVYLAQTGTKKMWVSKDSGKESWKSIDNSKVTTVQDLVVADAETVYTLDSVAGSGVSKTVNSGASWGTTKEPTKTVTPYMITLAPNGDVLYGGTTGYVAFSNDGGATFDRVGVDFGTSNAIVVAHPDYANNNLLYVGITNADGTGSVKRKTASTSTAPAATRGGTTMPITGMAVVEDVVFVLSANATADSLLYKSYKLETSVVSSAPFTDSEWSSVSASTERYTNSLNALKLSLDDGDPKLWTIDTASAALEGFTDTQSVTGPTLGTPDNQATVNINPGTGRGYDVTFIWSRLGDSDIDEQQLQIATDSSFDAVIYDATFTGITTNTVARVIGPTGAVATATAPTQRVEFMPGETYYWRVRNGAGAPMYSPWSESRSFTIEEAAAAALSFAQTASPAIGATSIRLEPTFVWPPYTGAIGYEIMVSTDPTFAIIDYSHNVENAFYKSEALAYSTTYYWRVRGVTGPALPKQPAPGGDWSTGVFTTMGEPVAAVEKPPEQIIITQPGEPGEVQIVQVPGPSTIVPQPIPSYLLWLIICVGAVLIISLIVLIVRTRRVT